MNLEARMTPGLNVGQQLNLAPQLLQWLRLLQLPSTELCAMVQHELEVNPTLEIEDDGGDSDVGDAPESVAEAIDAFEQGPTSFDDDAVGLKLEMLKDMDSDWRDDSATASRNHTAEDDEKRQFMMDCITARESLQDHLSAQLAVRAVSGMTRSQVELIIGSLDPRGYLTGTLDELAAHANVSIQNLEAALALVQTFDPPGVGARNLAECLWLQIRDKESLTARIVSEYLEAVGRRQYRDIAVALDVEEEDVAEAVKDILQLNPEPGLIFSRESTRYIAPDVTIRKMEDELIVELHDEYIPRVRVNANCKSLLERGTLSADDLTYLRKKMRASSFLIQGIRQRQETLRKVASEILAHQSSFLGSVDGELNPLTMAQVAQSINVHETTVSRALANKYVQTPRGLYEMKYFFRAGYQCEDGSALTPSVVKDLIADLVGAESSEFPLTDLVIVDCMKKRGITLARRTVAKYREELGIASSKERQTSGSKRSVAAPAGVVSEPVFQSESPVAVRAYA